MLRENKALIPTTDCHRELIVSNIHLTLIKKNYYNIANVSHSIYDQNVFKVSILIN